MVWEVPVGRSRPSSTLGTAQQLIGERVRPFAERLLTESYPLRKSLNLLTDPLAEGEERELARQSLGALEHLFEVPRHGAVKVLNPWERGLESPLGSGGRRTPAMALT